MNDFEREEYKNLLSDYIKASERILELEKENQELKANNKEIEKLYLNENKHWSETIDSLRKENQNLKKGIANEIDILIARRFDAYECEDYQTYNLLNDIMDELEKVLEE